MTTIDLLTKRDFLVKVIDDKVPYQYIKYVDAVPLEVMMLLDTVDYEARFVDDELNDYWCSADNDKYSLFGYDIYFNGTQFEYRGQLYDSLQTILDPET